MHIEYYYVTITLRKLLRHTCNEHVSLNNNINFNFSVIPQGTAEQLEMLHAICSLTTIIYFKISCACSARHVLSSDSGSECSRDRFLCGARAIF